MATQSPALPESALKALGGKGKKLHTHEMHIRRTANKGYIALHDLKDALGNHPADGQRPQAEYSLPDHASMMAHVGQHMGEMPEEDGEEQ